jgi:hypothetical protein
MAMNDKAAQYKKLLKNNVDRLIIAVMYGLMFFLIYLWQAEQATQTLPPEQLPAKLEDAVARNSAARQIKEMAQPQSIEQHPAILQVSRFNMFDYKAVKEKDKIEKEANEKISQVEAAMKEGRNAEAKRILEEVLKVIPAHQRARELMEKLNSSLPETSKAGAPAAGSAGTTARPATTPVQ